MLRPSLQTEPVGQRIYLQMFIQKITVKVYFHMQSSSMIMQEPAAQLTIITAHG